MPNFDSAKLMTGFLCLSLSLCVCAVSGCSGSDQLPPATNTGAPKPTAVISELLQGYADSGTLDSGAELIGSEIESVADEALSPEKKSELSAMLDELMSAGSPDKVKAIAKKMLAVLDE